jgi:hypothetical protein
VPVEVTVRVGDARRRTSPKPPFTLHAMSLCATFHTRAIATWLDIALGERIGLVPGEESITDYHLLAIQRAHPLEVRAHRYSKWKESRASGADWEWWLGGYSGWVALRIQAKKIDFRKQWFPGLDKSSWGKRQVDRLIESSTQDHVAPWYCFYASRDEIEAPFECRCGCVLGSSFVRGCSLVPAAHVRRLIDAKRKGFEDFIPPSIPWSCLFCCPRWGANAGRLVDRIHAVLQWAVAESDYGQPIGPEAYLPPLIERPPDYVRALLGDDDAQRSTRLSPPRHISSVLVITETGWNSEESYATPYDPHHVSRVL